MKAPIQVFMTDGILDTVPSLREALLFLSSQGHRLTLITPNDDRYRDFADENPQISVLRIPARKGHGKLRRLTALIRWVLAAYRIIPEPQSVVIGVDAEGLMMARIAVSRSRCRLVYYSLEILCVSDKPTLGNRIVKAIERSCHRHAELTVIQDKHRAKLLSNENRIGDFRLLYMPNASGGSASNAKSDYLRTRLGIGANRRIVLYAGTIAPWANSLGLAESVQTWPENFVLVFQCRQRPVDEYGQRVLKMADSKRIWVLSEPVSADELPKLVSSCDIGLAIYFPQIGSHITGQNVAVMGKASGKLATYLQQGIPVIVTKHPSLNYVDEYMAGVMIDSLKEIEEALRRITHRYSDYSTNANRCFNSEFDITESIKHFSGFIGEIPQ